MRKIFSITVLLTFFFLLIFLSCEENPTESNVEVPEVTTGEVINITDTTAQCGGTITSDGGATVSARGVCWSTNQTPTVADNKTTDGTGAGSFTSNITDLTAGTTYYVCAYATNSAGTGYGSAISFTTLSVAPILTTADISEITQTTAQCGGIIASDGGAAVTTRGVCWSTSQTPTVSDDKTDDDAGAGSFTSNITGLTPGNNYHIRAYATNSAGTGYGNAKSFTTLTWIWETGEMTDIDGNTYSTVKIGNQWWMAENLKVTRYRDGSLIPNVIDPNTWLRDTGAYCNYDNNANYYTVVHNFGRLYNWYAVNDNRNIAPEGWHVPSDAEWQTLVDHLGGEDVAGGKLKESGTNHWTCMNTATNESGFTAIAGGYRSSGGWYSDIYNRASFWSSTESNSSSVWYRSLYCISSEVGHYDYSKAYGYSVRCVRD